MVFTTVTAAPTSISPATSHLAKTSTVIKIATTKVLPSTAVVQAG